MKRILVGYISTGNNGGIDTYCMPIAPNIALIWRKLPEPKEIDYGNLLKSTDYPE